MEISLLTLRSEDSIFIPNQSLKYPRELPRGKLIIRIPHEESFYDFGILCVSEPPNLYVEARVIINPSNCRRYTHYEEYFTPDEGALPDQIACLTTRILKQPESFNKELISELKLKPELFSSMDIMANYFLTARKDRLTYLQSIDNNKRFGLILTAIERFIKLKKKENKKHISIEERFRQTPYPRQIKKRLLKELSKLRHTPKNSIEYGRTVDYLNWTMQIPWKNSTPTALDLKSVIPILNESHYGLLDIKHEILERLAIEQLSGCKSGMALCLAGPPGTGKTSIASAIAKATGRAFYRIALGGVTDESTLRGHRRTYAGSIPGRIIDALCTTGSSHPVILLDEIEKITSHRDSASAALLEILDPEQNHSFIDRYIGLPVDLSQIMFICTVNDKHQLSSPLADRLDFIDLQEYSKDDRLIILKEFILPKALKNYCLENLPIEISSKVLNELACIPQVRIIERKIQKLLRMAAVDIKVHQHNEVKINFDFARPVLNIKTKPFIGFN